MIAIPGYGVHQAVLQDFYEHRPCGQMRITEQNACYNNHITKWRGPRSPCPVVLTGIFVKIQSKLRQESLGII